MRRAASARTSALFTVPHSTYSTTSRVCAAGHAQALHADLVDRLRVELGVDLRTAAVDEHDAVAARGQRRDLVERRVLAALGGHRVPAVLQHDQHPRTPLVDPPVEPSLAEASLRWRGQVTFVIQGG